MNLYVNGALASTTSGITGGDWSGGDGAALGTLGQANTGGIGNGQANTESFDGEMAIFRAYRDRVLTAGEVADNYNAVIPEPSATLLCGLGAIALLRRRR